MIGMGAMVAKAGLGTYISRFLFDTVPLNAGQDFLNFAHSRRCRLCNGAPDNRPRTTSHYDDPCGGYCRGYGVLQVKTVLLTQPLSWAMAMFAYRVFPPFCVCTPQGHISQPSRAVDLGDMRYSLDRYDAPSVCVVAGNRLYLRITRRRRSGKHTYLYFKGDFGGGALRHRVKDWVLRWTGTLEQVFDTDLGFSPETRTAEPPATTLKSPSYKLGNGCAAGYLHQTKSKYVI